MKNTEVFLYFVKLPEKENRTTIFLSIKDIVNEISDKKERNDNYKKNI